MRDVILQGDGTRIPRISPQTNTWEAILTLLNSNVNAIAVGPPENIKEGTPNRRWLAISGYSILSKLLQTTSKDYEAVLSAPCVDKSLSVGEVTSEDDIVSLLHVFDASSFGYALSEDQKTRNFNGIVSLTDLLRLYLNGEIESDMIAREVASYPVFSLPKNTTIKDTIEQMILQKLRRIRISDTHEMVSDREILKFLFNADRIFSWRKGHFGLFDGSLHHIQTFTPPWVDSDMDLKSAAKALLESKRDCVFCKDGIVTPWDLIMKPWRARRLRLK